MIQTSLLPLTAPPDDLQPTLTAWLDRHRVPPRHRHRAEAALYTGLHGVQRVRLLLDELPIGGQVVSCGWPVRLAGRSPAVALAEVLDELSRHYRLEG